MSLTLHIWRGSVKVGAIYYDYCLADEIASDGFTPYRGFVIHFPRADLYQVSTVFNSFGEAGKYYHTFEEAREILFGLILAKRMTA